MDIFSKLRNLRKYGLRHVLLNRLWGKPFSFFEKVGIHVLPVHYYSPVPDTRELRRNFNQWYRESPLQGVNLRVDQQIDLLMQLSAYQERLQELPAFDQMQKAGFGPGYGEVEAYVLSAMIYHFQPNAVIEVGSGVSSIYILKALESNNKGLLHCIEPYPHDVLKTTSNSRLKLTTKRVQDISVEEFRVLGENDFLFIDSSHICKLGSDVNYLILEVLPALMAGVIVHFHDIPLPYPCSQNYEHWIFKQHMFWNEAALVHAFLCFNSAFQILLSTAFLHYHHPESLRSCMPVYDNNKHFPSSLWIRKLS